MAEERIGSVSLLHVDRGYENLLLASCSPKARVVRLKLGDGY